MYLIMSYFLSVLSLSVIVHSSSQSLKNQFSFEHRSVSIPVTYKELPAYKLAKNPPPSVKTIQPGFQHRIISEDVPDSRSEGSPDYYEVSYPTRSSDDMKILNSRTHTKGFIPIADPLNNRNSKAYELNPSSSTKNHVQQIHRDRNPPISFEEVPSNNSEIYVRIPSVNKLPSKHSPTNFIPSETIPSVTTLQERAFGVSVTPILDENPGKVPSFLPPTHETVPQLTPEELIPPLPYHYGYYRNHWTNSAQKPPIIDPSKAAAIYRQRIKALQFFPDHEDDSDLYSGKGNGFILDQSWKDRLQQQNDNKPKYSLLYLGKKGPSFPLFSSMVQSLLGMMETMVDVTRNDFENGFLSQMQHVLTKLSGPYGDNEFDIFDFLPLLAVLVATGLILAGMFPEGMNTFGLNPGNIIISRKLEDDPTILDVAMNQLESGVMMISALRYEEGCSARLACKLGDMAKTSLPNQNMISGAINMILGDKFGNFSRSFEDIITDKDRSSCDQECFRCISI